MPVGDVYITRLDLQVWDISLIYRNIDIPRGTIVILDTVTGGYTNEWITPYNNKANRFKFAVREASCISSRSGYFRPLGYNINDIM